VLPVDDADLAFADFGGTNARTPKRPNAPSAHPREDADSDAEEVRDETARRTFGFLERETGFEPATLGLGSRCSTS
jgi:hypothetical protein